MPWTAADAKKHTSAANTPKKQRQWEHVANSFRENCIGKIKGKPTAAQIKRCEARAIEVANGVVKSDYEEIVKARGEGQGVGGERQGIGGPERCVCPECGHTIKHKPDTPCKEEKCPKCGATMAPQTKGMIFSGNDSITENCICVECGRQVRKGQALCNETKCPDCGSPMIAKERKSFPMRITKATTQGGRMYWRGSISDTDWDAENERMTLTLFDDFKYQLRLQQEKPFVSLSHYGRMEDRSGELGTVQDIWTRHDAAEAEGWFHDNRLGKRVFQVVREELQQIAAGEKIENPVRFSIGFYPKKAAKDKDGRTVYLRGELDHVAVTRVPVNPRTGFTYVVEKSMKKTRKEDALSIVEDEYLEDIETLDEKQRTEKADVDDLIIKSEEDSPLNEEQEIILRANLREEGFEEDEIEEKAWSYGQKKELPDSAYAWVETGPGCEKKDGKRPQKCRHLPYKDASGKVDCAHVRAALQAIGGARTGKPMKGVPSSAKQKLRRALKGCQRSKAEFLDVELTEYEQGRVDGYNAALDMLEIPDEVEPMTEINKEVVKLEEPEIKGEIEEVVDPIDQHVELLKGTLSAEGQSRSEKVQKTEAVLRSLAAHCQSVINESTPVGPDDIAKSFSEELDSRLRPLLDEIAVLKKVVSEGTSPEVPQGKALKFDISPEETMRKAKGVEQSKNSIHAISRRSVGLDDENL